MKQVLSIAAGILIWSMAAHAGDAPLQSGRAESRALATEGVQGLRPADPRALEAAAASHRRAKAALPVDEARDLDALAQKLRPNIVAASVGGGDLIANVAAIVRMSVPGLSAEEARSVADYIVHEITHVAQARGGAAGDQDEAQLRLQQRTLLLPQSGNRNYTAVSNVMKTKRGPIVSAKCIPVGGTGTASC